MRFHRTRRLLHGESPWIDGHDFVHWVADPIIHVQQALRLPEWAGWGPLMTWLNGRCNAYEAQFDSAYAERK